MKKGSKPCGLVSQTASHLQLVTHALNARSRNPKIQRRIEKLNPI